MRNFIKMLYIDSFKSPIGLMNFITDNQGLKALNFSEFPLRGINSNELIKKETRLSKIIKDKLTLYFKGDIIQFHNIPLTFEATLFQKRIYKILKEQPYGTVTTYGEIAHKYEKLYSVKNLSAQAVGGALNRNPILIIIPCHRVKKKDGSLGGFNVGIQRKQFLLELENYGNKKAKEKNIKKKKSYKSS